jgi:CRISPR-associated protein Cas1
VSGTEATFETACSPENLARAWAEVLGNDSEDGELGTSVGRFASDAERNLAELTERLRRGAYEPGPLTAVHIPKADGGVRTLQVSSAADRIVERAVAQVLTPAIDPWLSASSFAYRPGRSVSDAVRVVASLRDEGLAWVAHTDIDNCFDTIPKARVLRLLHGLGIEERLLALTERLLTRPVRVGKRTRPAPGLSQGSALSPVLCNLHLDQFDRHVERDGFPLVRYADDLVILARTVDEARAGLETADRAAHGVGQRLGADKTEIASFTDGFAFLGEDFNDRYPPDDPTGRRSEPQKRTLFVGHQGARVRMDSGRVLVEKDDRPPMLSIPSAQVGRIVLNGSVGLTAGARSWALNEGVDVVLLSHRGNYLGSLVGARRVDATLRRMQYRRTEDPAVALAVGRQIVFGKITNQRALLTRYGRRDNRNVVPEVAAELDLYRRQALDAGSVEVLMGVEGIAARRYFEALVELVPSDLGFTGRNRRPPPDVVNSSLGYGYAILEGEATAALVGAGLEPGVGFLHADDPGRASLSLDLMEEFRPLVVDTVVVELARRRALTSRHGRRDERTHGILLTEKGRKLVTARLEDRLLTMASHAPSRTRVTYRRLVQLQAASLARIIRTGVVDYQTTGWR